MYTRPLNVRNGPARTKQLREQLAKKQSISMGRSLVSGRGGFAPGGGALPPGLQRALDRARVAHSGARGRLGGLAALGGGQPMLGENKNPGGRSFLPIPHINNGHFGGPPGWGGRDPYTPLQDVTPGGMPDALPDWTPAPVLDTLEPGPPSWVGDNQVNPPQPKPAIPPALLEALIGGGPSQPLPVPRDQLLSGPTAPSFVGTQVINPVTQGPQTLDTLASQVVVGQQGQQTLDPAAAQAVVGQGTQTLNPIGANLVQQQEAASAPVGAAPVTTGGGLIPLGGGMWMDPNTGVVHGLGGGTFGMM